MSDDLVKRLRLDWTPILGACVGTMIDAADRITELETALRAVHRHAMTQYGIRTADQCSAALRYIDDICRAALAEEER